MKILHLDSSPREERSHSRQLTRAFVNELMIAHPGASVRYRDLGHNPPPHVSQNWVAAAYSDAATHSPELQAAIAPSNELVDELLAADIVVIGAPMYNFSVPSTLKAYIDQIVRVGRTFDSVTSEGLATGKKMFVLSARGVGGYGAGGAMEGMDFQEPYLRAVFGFIGITDVTFVHDEKADSGDSSLFVALQEARKVAREYSRATALDIAA